MFYTLSLISFVLLILLYAVYVSRERIAPYLPRKLQSYVRSYAPLNTWEDAAEEGLSTGNFNVRDNLSSGDTREGLDPKSLNEVRRLMDRYSLTFDEARLRRQKDIFRRMGIDPDTGLPLDKKAITSLS